MKIRGLIHYDTRDGGMDVIRIEPTASLDPFAEGLQSAALAGGRYLLVAVTHAETGAQLLRARLRQIASPNP